MTKILNNLFLYEISKHSMDIPKDIRKIGPNFLINDIILSIS